MIAGQQARRAAALWSTLGPVARLQSGDGWHLREPDMVLRVSAAAAPRRGRDGARLRGGPDRGGSAGTRALRLRLRRAGAAVPGGRRLPPAGAAHAALPLGATLLHRGRAGARAHRARHRQLAARHRRHGVPRHHGSPRPARCARARALRPTVGDRPRDDGGRATGGRPTRPWRRGAPSCGPACASRRPRPSNRGAPRLGRGAPSAGGLGAMSGPPSPSNPRATMPATPRTFAKGGRRA